jgi:hypothetical protein
VRKILQPPAYLAYACLDPALNLWRKTEENGIKLAGVDFRGLLHGPSVLPNTHAALSQVGLATLDARNELRIQFGLVFEVIRQPILKLQGLLGRQLPHLSLDGFELAHGNSVPLSARPIKVQALKVLISSSSLSAMACTSAWVGGLETQLSTLNPQPVW